MKKGTDFNTFGIMILWWLLIALVMLVGCEKSSDGPIDVSNDEFSSEIDGFFRSASLDSGKTIHLLNDTLYLDMGKMWSFSNCALRSIDILVRKEDSVLWIEPSLKVRATEEDCPAPYYRPDTTLKILLSEKDAEGVGLIKVKNDMDSVLDSILLRRGSFFLDTFYVYMDSSFAHHESMPLRTKEKKKGKTVPTIMRVLDSLTPRVFLWRTLKSTCTHRVDMCKSTVADTIYPNNWTISDTNLVPVHYSCADSDSVYCINSKWENDSTSLGPLQERHDTIWHYSTYYMEMIPECATFNSFAVASYGVGNRVRFIREYMKPNETETICGPSSKKDMMIYNLSNNRMVIDTDSTVSVDSLYQIWKKATVAPDTLIVDSTKK